MGNLQTQQVHHQKALFGRDLPFKPQYGMMLYVEAGANEEIDGYFHKNMGEPNEIDIKALPNI